MGSYAGMYLHILKVIYIILVYFDINVMFGWEEMNGKWNGKMMFPSMDIKKDGVGNGG